MHDGDFRPNFHRVVLSDGHVQQWQCRVRYGGERRFELFVGVVLSAMGCDAYAGFWATIEQPETAIQMAVLCFWFSLLFCG
jgi:hypothetical protein